MAQEAVVLLLLYYALFGLLGVGRLLYGYTTPFISVILCGSFCNLGGEWPGSSIRGEIFSD